MEKRKIQERKWIWLFASLITFLSGCTHTYNAPKGPVAGYQQTSKIPLRVEVYLSNELRTAKWEKQMLGDTFQIPLGGTFAQNSEVLARELFTSVVVTNGAAVPAKAGVDAILIPRMVLAEQTQAMWAFGTNTLTVMLEWTLKDAQENTIWVDTVKGEGEANAGNIFTDGVNGRERVKKMLEDLFHKSFQSISSARAIRDFAAARQTANAKGP